MHALSPAFAGFRTLTNLFPGLPPQALCWRPLRGLKRPRANPAPAGTPLWFRHRGIAFLLLTTLLASPATIAQQKRPENATTTADARPLLTRTTTRHEHARLGYGGTVTLVGAPEGSVTIEAWSKSEVDLTADIEIKAPTEEDLNRLSALDSFLFDEDTNHVRIITTGTHDKNFMKRTGKNFPKRLFNLPWKIDYHIRVPQMVDVEINAGRGAIVVNGVEGAISLRALESDAALSPAGGLVTGTIGAGKVNVRLPERNWRGAGVDLQVAEGALTVEVPANFNGEINADVLRTGRVENNLPALLLPRERTVATPQSLKARAGGGGPSLSFTVGDGVLRLVPAAPAQ